MTTTTTIDLVPNAGHIDIRQCQLPTGEILHLTKCPRWEAYRYRVDLNNSDAGQEIGSTHSDTMTGAVEKMLHKLGYGDQFRIRFVRGN